MRSFAPVYCCIVLCLAGNVLACGYGDYDCECGCDSEYPAAKCWNGVPLPKHPEHVHPYPTLPPPRHAQNIPTFAIDANFHIIDGKSNTKWIATATKQAEALGQKIENEVIGAGNSLLKFEDVAEFGYDLMATVGIDFIEGNDEQPIQLDLTNLFNELKKNVLDIVDQSTFQLSLNNLKASYRTYTDALRGVRHDQDPENLLQKISPVLFDMEEVFNSEIHVQEYVDKYAYFMVQPLAAHASLHYSAALLRTTAQMNVYYADPTGRPHLLSDACNDLAQFSRKLGEYKEWYDKYWTQAHADRIGAVPARPSCSSTCKMWKEQCKAWNGESTDPIKQEWAVSYSWKDSWPMLGMSEFTESWNSKLTWSYTRKMQYWGVSTDGSAFAAEVHKYVTDMNAKLESYGNDMANNFDVMTHQVSAMLKKCPVSTSINV